MGVQRDYFRGDQRDGITPPNLSKSCTYAEHICHARGKLTQFTSISLDRTRIRDFGDTIYQVLRQLLDEDAHITVEHEMLLSELRRAVQETSKQEKAQAVSALRRAIKRREGLIDWKFDTSQVDRKNIIAWAMSTVQKYFSKVQS